MKNLDRKFFQNPLIKYLLFGINIHVKKNMSIILSDGNLNELFIDKAIDYLNTKSPFCQPPCRLTKKRPDRSLGALVIRAGNPHGSVHESDAGRVLKGADFAPDHELHFLDRHAAINRLERLLQRRIAFDAQQAAQEHVRILRVAVRGQNRARNRRFVFIRQRCGADFTGRNFRRLADQEDQKLLEPFGRKRLTRLDREIEMMPAVRLDRDGADAAEEDLIRHWKPDEIAHG